MRTFSLHFSIGLLFLSFCIMSCKTKKTMSQTPASASEISFTSIRNDSYSALDKAENLLIDNASDWAEFWSRANSNTMPPPESPKVDFSQHIVLVSCMGTRNSGGHMTKIIDTKTDGETVYASIVNYTPGKSCLSTMALTNPYHIIQIEKGNIKKAVFSTEDRVNECK